MQESGSALVQELFRNTDNNNAKGKLNFISVGAKFQTQLSQLMDKLKNNVSNNRKKIVAAILDLIMTLDEIKWGITDAPYWYGRTFHASAQSGSSYLARTINFFLIN